MLLLDIDNQTINSIRNVVVISPTLIVQNEIAELLRSNGVENVDVLNNSFQNEDIFLNAEETVGVVIDIESNTNIDEIIEHVTALVPQKMWCCLIGESDSISLAQRLAEDNILYFNRVTQLNLMVAKITANKMAVPTTRNTVKICMLGCKGGIGATFLSIQIANEIVKTKNVPVLLVQGSNGSQDLDLLFDKQIQGDIVEFDKNLDIYMGDHKHLLKEDLEKYNFVIFDQPIFNVNKDEYVNFFDLASTFVLITERHPNSLRVAKRFMEQCERQRNEHNRLIRTFFCIEDCNLEHSQLMSKGDIESLMNCSVDAIVPFLKKTSAKTIVELKLSKSMKKVINKFSMLVIGATPRNKNSQEKSSFIKTFWEKLLS